MHGTLNWMNYNKMYACKRSYHVPITLQVNSCTVLVGLDRCELPVSDNGANFMVRVPPSCQGFMYILSPLVYLLNILFTLKD